MAELPPFVPAITYDGDVSEFRKFGPHLAPNEFEGWRQEVLWGSLGDDLAKRYVTPFDTGWENRIHWDHAFPGRDALAAIAIDVSALPRWTATGQGSRAD